MASSPGMTARATFSCIAPIALAEVKLLYESQAVSFDIERTTRGLRAVNIKLI